MQFQTGLVLGLAYYFSGRLIPVILAGYLFQIFGLIDFFLR
jgi:hypothetical protein